MFEISDQTAGASGRTQQWYRKSLQSVMPFQVKQEKDGSTGYDIYPGHSLGAGKIFNGYSSLAEWITDQRAVIIEGYTGVLWNDVQHCLDDAFQKTGIRVEWIQADEFLKSSEVVQEIVAPFLGERDSVWGTKTDLKLEQFFNLSQIQSINPSPNFDCSIVIGTGASLVDWDAPVIYLDVPKNEIQYRMRAESVTNLGMSAADEPAQMYKQNYFVDWVVLNEYKSSIRDRITIRGDVQWESNINWMFTQELTAGLQNLAKTVFRVRPWFEPGAWGGHWMQERIDGLNKDEVNYAWSFELIVPENGLVFESDGYLLEVPFDELMLQNNRAILGRHADFFGTEFPIRFDFLDTWEGGNLSIQCHPSLSYIRKNFGEHITQDETYYILDCKKGAQVYLGFQDGIDPIAFRAALENSKANEEEINVQEYVQSHTANKHDLFLIPNGTVHSAGADNLVLEISSTPYIFTFKMYDWLRLDLNGEPRAINIEHAYNNLRFERQGEKVKKELIAQPQLIRQSKDCTIWHLPTHAEHFYDVHRLEFENSVVVNTDDSCNVLMLVEGEAVAVEVGGETHIFNYAETFVVPAAAENYTLVNQGPSPAKVVKAFIKKSIDHLK